MYTIPKYKKLYFWDKPPTVARSMWVLVSVWGNIEDSNRAFYQPIEENNSKRASKDSL